MPERYRVFRVAKLVHHNFLVQKHNSDDFSQKTPNKNKKTCNIDDLLYTENIVST